MSIVLTGEGKQAERIYSAVIEDQVDLVKHFDLYAPN